MGHARIEMPGLYVRAFRSLGFGTFILAALLFLSAGTLEFWQAWVFLAVFTSASAAITAYLAIHDPELLDRRMRGGPFAEKERSQKIIMLFVMIGFAGFLVVAAFDRRFGWSRVPAYVCWMGEALMAIGFLLVWSVLKANPFAASTIQIAEGQSVISTGPYALVRHPMYGGSMPLLAGVPLALG